MLKHFKSSPLWLIGLFIIFAQGTAGVAAVKIEGWPQGALVIFVIAYSAIVTLIFFTFLWMKPENFYGPSEYGVTNPRDFVNALRGLPNDTAEAVALLERDPTSEDALFSLLDNLLPDDVKQHLIFMRRNNDSLDISNPDENDQTHRYQIIMRNRAFSVGIFSPASFVSKLRGTELVRVSGSRNSIILSSRGKLFSDWLIRHERDAEIFTSDHGGWGEQNRADEIIRERFLGS